MEPNEMFEALGPWRGRVLRPAWRPVVEEGDGPPTASKFCGTPWTGPDAPWPECSGCKIPLALALQLRLDDLPVADGAFGPGLLQFFYCPRTGDYGCEGESPWVPFSDQATRLRVIDPIPQGEAAPTPPNYEPPAAPARRIVGWGRIDDWPGYFERRENGLVIDYDLGANRMRVRCPEIGFDETTRCDDGLLDEISQAALDDKLGGWPRWAQREEYPSCPRCGRRMGLVFQLASHDHFRDAFGEFGIGHVTQCPEHKDVLAFGSAR